MDMKAVIAPAQGVPDDGLVRFNVALGIMRHPLACWAFLRHYGNLFGTGWDFHKDDEFGFKHYDGRKMHFKATHEKFELHTSTESFTIDELSDIALKLLYFLEEILDTTLEYDIE